jgi:hypothetical protein
LPSGEEAGLQLLRNRVAKLPKNTAIVIYCGCRPWSNCPNGDLYREQLR